MNFQKTVVSIPCLLIGIPVIVVGFLVAQVVLAFRSGWSMGLALNEWLNED